MRSPCLSAVSVRIDAMLPLMVPPSLEACSRLVSTQAAARHSIGPAGATPPERSEVPAPAEVPAVAPVSIPGAVRVARPPPEAEATAQHRADQHARQQAAPEP